ncbi:MAG: hypothetical protein RIN56_18515 [Sporomusaceae bacterium]|nr:hypothetical protein [Sporomusaceae bacterium]
MKKITLIALLVFAFTSVASAAPLMDFEKGKVALDYTFRPSLDFSATGTISGYAGDLPVIGSINQSFSFSGSRDFSGDSNVELGLTFGIGNKWALQYRQYNPTGNIWSYRDTNPSDSSEYIQIGFDGKIRSDEYNLLYSFNKNWAGFVGAVRYKGGVSAGGSASINGWSGGLTIPELWSDDQDTFQFGVVGSYNIANKTNLWGLASFGSDYRNWEAGLSYDLGKDIQLNVSYRDTKFDSLKFAGANINAPAGLESSHASVTSDVTVKGWGFGLTYKF